MVATKNALIDKAGAGEAYLKNLFNKSIVFSKTDETWKSKRKASAHAFYKERLVNMLDVLKDIVLEK